MEDKILVPMTKEEYLEYTSKKEEKEDVDDLLKIELVMKEFFDSLEDHNLKEELDIHVEGDMAGRLTHITTINYNNLVDKVSLVENFNTLCKKHNLDACVEID